MDITMPRTGGMQALQQIVGTCRETRVLVLTMHDDPAYLRSVMAAGASGYVLKRSVDADLLSAIRAVHNGRTYVDSDLANSLMHDVFRRSRHEAGARPFEAKSLAEREAQVLKLVA